MSICHSFGKDKLIYVTKEDHEKPCSITVPELDSRFEEHGFVSPDGKLNWSCPCVGNMTAGPCGLFFREAFSCFHESKSEPKGSECIDKFMNMQQCLSKYPNLYPTSEKDDGMSEMSKELTKKD